MPMGLTHGAKVIEDIPEDGMITWDNVEAAEFVRASIAEGLAHSGSATRPARGARAPSRARAGASAKKYPRGLFPFPSEESKRRGMQAQKYPRGLFRSRRGPIGGGQVSTLRVECSRGRSRSRSHSFIGPYIGA